MKTLEMNEKSLKNQGGVLTKLLLKVNVVGHIRPLSKRPFSLHSFDIKFGTLGQSVTEKGVILKAHRLDFFMIFHSFLMFSLISSVLS